MIKDQISKFRTTLHNKVIIDSTQPAQIAANLPAQRAAKLINFWASRSLTGAYYSIFGSHFCPVFPLQNLNLHLVVPILCTNPLWWIHS